MKAISFIKKNLMLVLAGAAIISFSSFKAVEKYLQTELTFVYTPAPGDTPYEQSSVENPDNWKPGTSCDENLVQEIACSITVPSGNTMGSGSSLQLDPSKVTIGSQQHGTTGKYNVVMNAFSKGYSDPISRPLN